jgi:Na+/glutamate symporter
MQKIPKKYALFVFVLLVAGPLSMVLSAVNTWWATGGTDFVRHWLPAWGRGFAIAWPTALALVSVVRKIMPKIVEH